MILIWQVLTGMSKAWLLKKKKKYCVKKKSMDITHGSSLGKSNRLPYMLQVKKSTFHKLL